jgi:hypothetical protein
MNLFRSVRSAAKTVTMAFVVACGLVAGFSAAPAQAANVLQKQIYMTGGNYDGTTYEGALPGCEAALGDIASRFAEKEGRFWNSALQILGFEDVRQTAFSPWAKATIPRRFCTAVALVSDGRRHKVDYWIGEDTGLIGASWGVEWCVVGLDRNWAYNPACKMARP